MRTATPYETLAPWAARPARWLFKRQNRLPRDSDSIVTAFRDGEVTLRENRRTEGFTNAVAEHGYQGVRAGDLVIHSMDAFAGAIGVSDSDGKASPVVHCYRPIANVDPRFYAYLLRDAARSGFIMSLAKGIRERSTAFDTEAFRSLMLPAPPLAKQRAIADYLDTETARIDALIEKKRRLVTKLRERLQAVIDNQLNGSSDSETFLKRYTTKIGSGKTPRGGSENYVSSGVLFLRSQNVGDGKLLLEDVAYIQEEVDREMHSTRIESGDVLLNITGASIGRSAIVPSTLGRANVNQHVCIVRLRKEIAPELIEFNLRSSRVQEFIQAVQVGGNREGLNFEQVGAIPVTVPHVSEHTSTVRFLERAEENYQRGRDLLVRQIELLTEHRQALITAAVTGEVEVAGASRGSGR